MYTDIISLKEFQCISSIVKNISIEIIKSHYLIPDKHMEANKRYSCKF